MASVWETMTRLEYKGYVIRVWRQAEVNTIGPDDQIQKAVYELNYAMASEHWNVPELTIPLIIKAIATLERVSAVEVLTDDGFCGACFYPNWP